MADGWFEKLGDSEFCYKNGNPDVRATDKMCSDFNKNGFVITRNLFSESEINKLNNCLINWKEYWDAEFSVKDPTDPTLRFHSSQWSDPGNDIMGLACKTVKVLQVSEDLLNRGEIYLYSGKVVIKRPKTGGPFGWHQDYGYWYHNRCLFPDFITCLIALTQSDKQNGGLQVLKGSNNCGRIDTKKRESVNIQTGADLKRVALLEKVLERVYVNLSPGDAVFFHGNTLHKSDGNLSENKRWNLIYSFNSKHNSPDRKHYNAQYTKPMEKLPADAVEKCEDLILHDREFLDPEKVGH